jgi:GNAT superfamily N-acetyltransferase
MRPMNDAAPGAAVGAIRLADSDRDIARSFPVMVQLRPHLVEAQFLATIRRQEAGGFRLALLEEADEVRAVAGFRVLDTLFGGRILYVDDLVTDGRVRSHGHGAALLDWLARRARGAGCQYLELDSGVQRFDAHRFYLTHRMQISAHHFRLKL